MTGGQSLSVFALAAALAMPLGAATAPPRIAFLDKGEVWELTAGGGSPQRRTRTGGKVEDFRVSPRGEFLAYAKRLRQDDARPICSIVIVNTATGSLIKELLPGDVWIDIDKWLGTTLLYHSSSSLEVNGIFEFDASRRTGRELELEAGPIALGSDMTPDGSLLAYVDNVGLGPTFEHRLHLVDTARNEDAVHVSRRSVMAPAIAPTKEAVAFVEVAGEGSKARDRVWVYRRADRSVTMLDDDVVRPKSLGAGLAWSPDSRYVLINFGGNVTVLDVAEGADLRKFRGVDACWSTADAIVVASMGRLETIDVVSGARRSLVARGTRPQCLYDPTW